jgi:hypothetical protein
MNTTRRLSGAFTNGFDCHDMLSCKSPSGAHRGRLRSLARGVAIALVGAMSFGASPAESGSRLVIDPKTYIRFNYDDKSALCLIKLYGKESAFRVDAIGNLDSPTKSYVYGIPQLKNAIIKDMDAIGQLNYGFKYLKHRYNNEPCRAWNHWLDKGWH